MCHPVLTSPTRTHRGANKLSEHTTTTLHPTRNPTACAPGFYLRLSFLVVFFFAPLCRVFHPLFFSFLPSPPPLTHPHYHHHSPPGPRPAFHPPAVSSCDLRLSPLPPFCRRPTYKKNTKTLDHAHTPHDRDSCFRVSWGLLKELACFNSVLAVCLFVRRAVSAAAHNYWRRRRPPWAQRRQKMVCSIVLSAFLLLCSGGPLLAAPCYQPQRASSFIHSSHLQHLNGLLLRNRQDRTADSFVRGFSSGRSNREKEVFTFKGTQESTLLALWRPSLF